MAVYIGSKKVGRDRLTASEQSSVSKSPEGKKELMKQQPSTTKYPTVHSKEQKAIDEGTATYYTVEPTKGGGYVHTVATDERTANILMDYTQQQLQKTQKQKKQSADTAEKEREKIKKQVFIQTYGPAFQEQQMQTWYIKKGIAEGRIKPTIIKSPDPITGVLMPNIGYQEYIPGEVVTTEQERFKTLNEKVSQYMIKEPAKNIFKKIIEPISDKYLGWLEKKSDISGLTPAVKETAKAASVFYTPEFQSKIYGPGGLYEPETKSEKVQAYLSGASLEFIRRPIDKPVTFVGTALLGAGLGGAFAAAPGVSGWVGGKIAGPVGGKIGQKVGEYGSKAVGSVLGGIYGGTQIARTILEPDWSRKGAILSETGWDLAAFSVGAKLGNVGVNRLSKIKLNLFKGKKPTPAENTFLKSQGYKIADVVKVDRYGNNYISREITPLAPEGQVTLEGTPATERFVTTSAGGKSTFLPPEYFPGASRPTGSIQRLVFEPGRITTGDAPRQIVPGVEQYDWSVRGAQPKVDMLSGKIKYIDVSGKQFPEPGMGKYLPELESKWLALDTKTGTKKIISQSDLVTEMGQLFVKDGGKLRWANEFMGDQSGWIPMERVTKGGLMPGETYRKPDLFLTDVPAPGKQTSLTDYGKKYRTFLSEKNIEIKDIQKVDPTKKKLFIKNTGESDWLFGRNTMNRYIKFMETSPRKIIIQKTVLEPVQQLKNAKFLSESERLQSSLRIDPLLRETTSRTKTLIVQEQALEAKQPVTKTIPTLISIPKTRAGLKTTPEYIINTKTQTRTMPKTSVESLFKQRTEPIFNIIQGTKLEVIPDIITIPKVITTPDVTTVTGVITKPIIPNIYDYGYIIPPPPIIDPTIIDEKLYVPSALGYLPRGFGNGKDAAGLNTLTILNKIWMPNTQYEKQKVGGVYLPITGKKKQTIKDFINQKESSILHSPEKPTKTFTRRKKVNVPIYFSPRVASRNTNFISPSTFDYKKPKTQSTQPNNRMQMNVDNVIGKNYFSKSKKKQTIKDKIWGSR